MPIKSRGAASYSPGSRNPERSRTSGPASGKTPSVPIRRCAIYTRKSSDEGLDQDFNSLQAQREACAAYVASQRHEGWVLHPALFDDGGYSGGSMERPGLQALMAEVGKGRIDVVVVYKVDRLTRSLTDFARIVDQFDTFNVSFVSVTQSFNTTTSMGRLTLNVLLSFAQFEREVTTERIRDKIAASKRKGIFMGVPVPLGYKVEQRKLVIVEEEAETVRLIFGLYAQYKSILAVKRELDFRQIRTKLRQRSKGEACGGIPFRIGTLSALLCNRIYVGEIVHKGQYFAGEHQAILTQEEFASVQAILAANLNGKTRTRHRLQSLLTGKIYDSKGNRMRPSSSSKNGLRYQYYCSRALIDRTRNDVGDPARISAPKIEAAVLEALRQRQQQLPKDALERVGSDAALVEVLLDRVEVYPLHILLTFTSDADHPSEDLPRRIEIGWTATKPGLAQVIEAPDTSGQTSRAEGHSEPDLHYSQRGNGERLIKAIARAHVWVDDLKKGRVPDLETIARNEQKSLRNIRMMINLAFLAPDIIKAAFAGTLPDALNATEIAQTLPLDWSAQRSLVGLE